MRARTPGHQRRYFGADIGVVSAAAIVVAAAVWPHGLRRVIVFKRLAVGIDLQVQPCDLFGEPLAREDARPQSGERIRGRHNIQERRTVQPDKKRFTVERMIGSGDLWVTEFILTYDGVPSYTVSIMEFHEGQVAHETQYFADRFDPSPTRSHLVEQAG